MTPELQAGIASVLTPAGRGAVATIGVQGAHVAPRVSRCFVSLSQHSLDDAPLGRTLFGRWRSGGSDPDQFGEELVICRTAAEELEIHCHGGAAAIRAILTDLHDMGFMEASWQEWVRTTRGRGTSRTAQVMLADALTERTAAILLDQYRGTLDSELRILSGVIERGHVEVAIGRLQELLARAVIGLHLTRPFRVALIGEPNVGKSSLINALLGYERSIVFAQAGTTRDVVSALTAVDGWPLELSDTAGLRASTDALEAAGMAKTGEQLKSADLILWVRDATKSSDTTPQFAPPHVERALVVWNKSDLLLPTGDRRRFADGLLVSATTRSGLAELQGAMVAKLCPQSPPPHAPVLFTNEQVSALQETLLSLQQGAVNAAELILSRLATSPE